MAEWSGAPPLPPREPGGAGDRFPLPPQQFLRFLAIPWSNVFSIPKPMPTFSKSLQAEEEELFS